MTSFIYSLLYPKYILYILRKKNGFGYALTAVGKSQVSGLAVLYKPLEWIDRNTNPLAGKTSLMYGCI